MVRFMLGSHGHIPLGLGDEMFEREYSGTLKPFISALYQYPKIPAALHYSGALLQRLERLHPELFMLIGDLVSRKQVELLGGGFYEPILSLLPFSDRIGQIELMTTYIRKQFGRRPQGCYLSGLAWEPQLTGPLQACGMKYTFLEEPGLDVFGRRSAGEIIGKNLSIAEDQGKTIAVFSVSRTLSSAFAEFRGADALARLCASSQEGLVCVFPEWFFPDSSGEFSEPRFHRFFEELSAFESQIEFTQPGKVFRTHRFFNKTYIPGSLDLSLREGLIACPEANNIYAKMMLTHVLINQFRGDKSRKRTAREELWKAQGCESFTPSISPKIDGMEQPEVRKSAYKALLSAEKLTRESGGFTPSLLYFDFDFDGQVEYLFQGELINCYIQPEGAEVFELDYLPRAWNYLDTFNPGFRRMAFADYLVSRAFPEETFGENPESIRQAGRNCGIERFELLKIDKDHNKIAFRLPSKPEIPQGNIEIEKTCCLKKEVFQVHYALYNAGTRPEDFWFVPSIDLAFPGEGGAFVRLLEQAPKILVFQDLKNETLLSLAGDRSFEARIFSIRAKGRYQSTCILPIQPVELAPGETFQTEFCLKIQTEDAGVFPAEALQLS
ncbi:MAG: DUF1926 domain-containing protein [Spirochaetaceae bacterium]|jgi:hypothetical protein|nr:DUF1926 domain-containing protein [Spirochaetaceae bacterium]